MGIISHVHTACIKTCMITSVFYDESIISMYFIEEKAVYWIIVESFVFRLICILSLYLSDRHHRLPRTFPDSGYILLFFCLDHYVPTFVELCSPCFSIVHLSICHHSG